MIQKFFQYIHPQIHISNIYRTETLIRIFPNSSPYFRNARNIFQDILKNFSKYSKYCYFASMDQSSPKKKKFLHLLKYCFQSHVQKFCFVTSVTQVKLSWVLWRSYLIFPNTKLLIWLQVYTLRVIKLLSNSKSDISQSPDLDFWKLYLPFYVTSKARKIYIGLKLKFLSSFPWFFKFEKCDLLYFADDCNTKRKPFHFMA